MDKLVKDYTYAFINMQKNLRFITNSIERQLRYRVFKEYVFVCVTLYSFDVFLPVLQSVLIK